MQFEHYLQRTILVFMNC